jgi:hypothetical protein
MQTVYYSLMKKLLAVVVVVFLGMAAGQAANGRQGKPLRTSILDAHEGVTIGVEPWTQANRYKEKFPKKTPFAAGIVALRLTIRNDNDEAVKLNLQRIRLLVLLDLDNKQELEAMTADDVADAVMLKQNGRDPTARRSPIPLPISRPKPTRDKNWEEFHGTVQNAGMPSSVIGAHSTMEGLVYFDLRSEWDLLQTARLYVPDLQRMTSKQAISYFDIDFSRNSSN